jgi:hypothetical protein
MEPRSGGNGGSDERCCVRISALSLRVDEHMCSLVVCQARYLADLRTLDLISKLVEERLDIMIDENCTKIVDDNGLRREISFVFRR